jgi:cytochrome oxidase assembly protein ShyY1
MTPASKFLTKALQAVAVLLLAAIFVGLGIWQLQRAAELKESLKVATTIDTRIVPLESVATPRVSLPPSALNKTVFVTGQYIQNFRAPNLIGKLLCYRSVQILQYWLFVDCGLSV